MAWGAYTEEELEESSPGAGDSTAEITFNPGEIGQFFVTRTDSSPIDDWRVAIEGSIEDTAEWAEDPPMRDFRLTEDQLEKSFIVAGVYACRIKIQNDETDTDTVAATVGWRLNGVNI